jgi:hypothetical protein
VFGQRLRDAERKLVCRAPSECLGIALQPLVVLEEQSLSFLFRVFDPVPIIECSMELVAHDGERLPLGVDQVVGLVL